MAILNSTLLNHPQMTSQVTNTNIIAGAASNSLIINNPQQGYIHVPQSMMMKPRPHAISFIGRTSGFREPDINVKLGNLHKAVGTTHDKVMPYFNYVSAEAAIEHLGSYNPIYAGKPKKLAMALLNCAAGRTASEGNSFYALVTVGLLYKLPAMIGVRKSGFRATYAALGLLDHWGQKFPDFQRFVNAYVPLRARKQIIVDCTDFALGIIPASFVKEEELNEMRRIKWEAREYRKMKKAEAMKPKMSPQDQYYRDARRRAMDQLVLQQTTPWAQKL